MVITAHVTHNGYMCIVLIWYVYCVTFLPGRSIPVSAIGPSSMIRLTNIWPAVFLIVQPMPRVGSLNKVIRLTPLE